MYPPTVIDSWGKREYAYDIYSSMLRDRIVILDEPIEDHVASLICGQLLFLEKQAPQQEICLYINSPGGVVSAGLAIYDTMNFISCPVSTVCMGQAASMGAILLCAGEYGKRYALPNSRIMIHQPTGAFNGQASDAEIHTNEMLRLKGVLNEILSAHTGVELKKISELTERDTFLTAQEAHDLGLVDYVIQRRNVQS